MLENVYAELLVAGSPICLWSRTSTAEDIEKTSLSSCLIETWQLSPFSLLVLYTCGVSLFFQDISLINTLTLKRHAFSTFIYDELRTVVIWWTGHALIHGGTLDFVDDWRFHSTSALILPTASSTVPKADKWRDQKKAQRESSLVEYSTFTCICCQVQAWLAFTNAPCPWIYPYSLEVWQPTAVFIFWGLPCWSWASFLYAWHYLFMTDTNAAQQVRMELCRLGEPWENHQIFSEANRWFLMLSYSEFYNSRSSISNIDELRKIASSYSFYGIYTRPRFSTPSSTESEIMRGYNMTPFYFRKDTPVDLNSTRES